jgi:hypothetical protein
MSRTYKSTKGPGYEYWKTLIRKFITTPGRATKQITNRILRRKIRHDLKSFMEPEQ